MRRRQNNALKALGKVPGVESGLRKTFAGITGPFLPFLPEPRLAHPVISPQRSHSSPAFVGCSFRSSTVRPAGEGWAGGTEDGITDDGWVPRPGRILGKGMHQHRLWCLSLDPRPPEPSRPGCLGEGPQLPAGVWLQKQGRGWRGLSPSPLFLDTQTQAVFSGPGTRTEATWHSSGRQTRGRRTGCGRGEETVWAEAREKSSLGARSLLHLLLPQQLPHWGMRP